MKSCVTRPGNLKANKKVSERELTLFPRRELNILNLMDKAQITGRDADQYISKGILEFGEKREEGRERGGRERERAAAGPIPCGSKSRISLGNG